MSGIPTPRTDTIVTGNSHPARDEYEDLAAFARALELELAVLQKRTDRYSGSLDKWIKQAQFWEGRAAILRHENNKLRKKLYPNK